MSIFKRDENPRDKIRRKVVSRLRNITTGEVIRWADNTITGIGQNMRETQKNLNRSDPAQALMHLEDMRQGAVSLLAAIQVLEERVNQEA
jgi:hypothetical protein